MLELRTKFGNFGNFGHISDGLRKQSSVRTQCCNLIGSEPLYIPCTNHHQQLITRLYVPKMLSEMIHKVMLTDAYTFGYVE